VEDLSTTRGTFATGDLLEIVGDELQYLRYVDRTKDLVVRGGMKISASELETYIAGYPKVAEVAVVAYPDELLGEKACAVVVARPARLRRSTSSLPISESSGSPPSNCPNGSSSSTSYRATRSQGSEARPAGQAGERGVGRVLTSVANWIVFAYGATWTQSSC